MTKKIRTHQSPPADFDIWKATDSELIRYGFPKKPVENKEHMKLWDKLKNKKLKCIIPEFKKI